MYNEILRYMGHKGVADTRIKKIIFSCLEKLARHSTPRFVIKLVPCAVVNNESVKLDSLAINSRALASHLLNCESAFVMTATLGASVDRLIAQRSVVDTLEALCLQACAAAKIEEYCDNIENELKIDAQNKNLRLTGRFSPGYGDFDIAYQTDILNLLNAQKRIGVGVTKTCMLSPLKTVTAIIGLSKFEIIRENPCNPWVKKNKCIHCNLSSCQFRVTEGKARD